MTSYMTATFMIEAIAGANALNKRSPGSVIVSSNESQTKSLEDEDGEVDGDSEFKSTTEFMPLMVPAGVHSLFCFSLLLWLLTADAPNTGTALCELL